MIKIIEGDLFDTNAKFICHQVNCAGKMGSGVALQIRQKYPHVYKEYEKVASEDMLGEVQIIPVNSKFIGHEPGDIWCGMKVKGFRETQWICNLFAQKSYGYDGKQYTSNEALRQCFKNLQEWCMRKTITSDKQSPCHIKLDVVVEDLIGVMLPILSKKNLKIVM